MGDLAIEIHSQRTYLLRVALLQLRDRDVAEDVVQETLLAAIQAIDRFGGRSSVKTWLTGILKHKIIDVIRRKTREPAVSTLVDAGDDGNLEDLDAFFDPDDHDHWQSKPAEWVNPEQDLERKQFMTTLEACLERLPAKTARVFVMREVMELESEEICQELGITATNLWVILYRARMLLRQCLEQNWFAAEANG